MSHDHVPDALTVLRTRSAVRDFAPVPVDDRTVDLLVEAMLAAPSASNRQAWRFVVVRTPDSVRAVRALAPGVLGVPALVMVACVDGGRIGVASGPAAQRVTNVARLCVAMAVENLLLAAHALGLGGCPVSSFHTGGLRVLLDLPPEVTPQLVVPLGRPARPLRKSDRRDPDEVIRYGL
jgi:nitroreductase